MKLQKYKNLSSLYTREEDFSSDLAIHISQLNVDEFVKSRHSGENRSPYDPQLLENTGFRLSPE